MCTVPAQIFCAPTRAKLIAAARFMPGVCGVLVSSWSPGMTLTPCSFQSTCACSLISQSPTVERLGHRGPTIHRQYLAGDHAAFVRGKIERTIGDVGRLDQPKQV